MFFFKENGYAEFVITASSNGRRSNLVSNWICCAKLLWLTLMMLTYWKWCFNQNSTIWHGSIYAWIN